MAAITLRRGDTKFLKFTRKDTTGQPILDIADSVYFTVKPVNLKGNALIQKKLDDMSFDQATGEYHFRIESEDTESLTFQTYRYDIQVVQDDIKKTIAYGDFKVLEEVTFKSDEA